MLHNLHTASAIYLWLHWCHASRNKQTSTLLIIEDLFICNCRSGAVKWFQFWDRSVICLCSFFVGLQGQYSLSERIIELNTWRITWKRRTRLYNQLSTLGEKHQIPAHRGLSSNSKREPWLSSLHMHTFMLYIALLYLSTFDIVGVFF